ncbi:MAG: pseudouridine synthase [Opitutales bacterium]
MAPSDPFTLPVLYEDAWLIAVHKPPGMLVHRSKLASHNDTPVALQTVRDQIGQPVFPVHRLDRPTSGLLVFARDSETAAGLAEQIRAGQLEKTYQAVVRGWPETDAGSTDRPLKPEYADNKAEASEQPARTDWRCLGRTEIPEPVDKYPTARYSLLEASPKTGRTHQIRRHLKHLNHPIIGDARHGQAVHNRFFHERYGCDRLLLAATALRFRHPRTGNDLALTCPVAEDMAQVVEALGFVPEG